MRGGCNLFNLEQLRCEYSDADFENLLMCGFIDDAASVFPLSLLMRGMVDSWEVWTDFRHWSPRRSPPSPGPTPCVGASRPSGRGGT